MKPHFLTAGAAFGLALAPAGLAQDDLTGEPGLSPSASAARAAAGTATVLLTNVVGAPASAVPGLPGVVFDPGTGTTDFDRVYGSPNGSWIITCFADLATTEDELLLVNGTLAVQEGTPGAWIGGTELCGTLDQRCSVNDSGDYTFTTNTDGPTTTDDYVVTNIGGAFGFAAREGDAIASLPGNTYDDLLDSALILADGTVGFSADGVDGTVTTTEDDLLILGSTLLLQEGVSVPTGQNVGAEFIENFDLGDFWASADGSSWLVLGDLTGSTSTDDVVIVNGAVVLQEGFPIPGSIFTDPIDLNGITAAYMDHGGNWYARGDNATTAVDWVVKNGAVIATLGQPIVTGSTELWDDTVYSPCFFMHVGDSNGNYVLGGVTDNADALLNGVLVYNGTDVICREGDPVDVDGNGAFDDDAFINTFGDDDGHLSDDGVFYMVVTLKDGLGASLGQAVISIDLAGSIGTNYCTATANSTGSAGVMAAEGSDVAASNDVTLIASGLPANQFGIFITSQTQGFVPGINGTSNGNLCVVGNIGRLVGPGQILSADAAGSFSLDLDLTQIPQGAGFVTVMAGETWNFQAWHRDTVGLGSNLTDGLSILFQ